MSTLQQAFIRGFMKRAATAHPMGTMIGQQAVRSVVQGLQKARPGTRPLLTPQQQRTAANVESASPGLLRNMARTS
jgi:hypothetical protein